MNSRKLVVVRSSRSRVDQSASDTANEEVVIHKELEGVVELLLLGFEHGVELLGLRNGTGESIEDKSASTSKQKKSA